MNRDALPSLAPKVFRFSDIDHFRSAVRNLAVEFIPLVRKISAAQIILNLPGCDINFTQSFPRIVEAQLAPNCTAIGFSMDDGLPIRFNGVERDRSAIAIGSNDHGRTGRAAIHVGYLHAGNARSWVAPSGSELEGV